MKSKKYQNRSIINRAPDGIVKYQVMLLLFLFLSPTAAGQQPSDSDDKSSSNNDFNTLNNSNVSPSMAVIVIVLVLAFLFTGCLAIYIRQCVDNSPSSTTGPVVITGENRSRRVQTRGLDPSVIETFPSFLYSAVKELKIGKGTLECAVCLNEFQEDETLRLLPKCDHVFHAQCIDAWLVGHTTCPVCRANLGLDPAQTGNPVESIHEHDLEGHDAELPLSTDVAQSYDDVVQVTIPEETTRKNDRNDKFPRSHSTGHSVIQPGDDCERFRLRLPAEVRRQLMARTKLKRATSMVALPRQSSSRRGFRISGGGEGSGSSRYGRFFGPLISRVNSLRLTARGTADGDLATSNSTSKRFLGTAVKPLESLPV